MQYNENSQQKVTHRDYHQCDLIENKPKNNDSYKSIHYKVLFWLITYLHVMHTVWFVHLKGCHILSIKLSKKTDFMHH